MNFESGLPIPRQGSREFINYVTRGMPIPHESAIGHSQGSRTVMSGGTRIVGGDHTVAARTILKDNRTISGQESCTMMNPEQPTPIGIGVVNNGNSWNISMEQTVLQRNGIGQNGNDGTTNGNGIGQSRSSWTPVTPDKIINERSNPLPVEMQENQVETENWEDLLGMYTGLLQEKTLDLNAVVEKLDPTPPPPVVHDNGNENWIASPIPYRNHNANQASTFNSTDPANWKRSDMAAIVSSTSSSASVSYANEAHNNGVHVPNMPFNPNQPTQVEGNVMRSTSRTSMLGSQQTQRFISKNLIDGFPVTCQNRYNLNSPPSLRPDAAASGVTDSSPFAPITPDNQGKRMDNQWVPEKINFLVEETSTPVKDSHENQTVSIADAENLYNELLQTIGDSPPSAISTTQKEHIISEDRDEQVIGLNETPQQKTPSRRKKHRPMVIREGKPKRTPMPKDPTNGSSNEIRVKRKYVRRKGVNTSNGESPVETIVKRKYVRRMGVSNGESPVETIVKRKYVRKKKIDNLKPQSASAAETPPKSCKKKLNFDSETVAQDESHEINRSQQDINVNVNPQDIQQNRRITGMPETQQNTYIDGSMQSEPNVPTTTLANGRYHALNVLARNMNTSLKHTWENEYNKVNKPVGINNSVIQSGMVPTNLQGTPQSFTSEGMPSLDERRGIKRQGSNVNAMDSILLYQKFLIGVAHRAYDNKNLSSILLENHKKMKMQNELRALEGNSRQMNGIYGNGSAMQLLYSSGRINPSCNTVNGGGNVDQLQFQPQMAATHYLQKHQVLSGMQPHTMRSIPEGASRYTQGAMISWNPTPTTPPKGDSRYAVTAYAATSLEKKQIAKPNSYNQRLEGLSERLQQHCNTPFKGYQQSSIIARGRPSQKNTEISVEIITHMLEDLHIYDVNKKHQNGLVYRGSEALIPFEPIKKRNLRPKVDLDPETERLWRLLMGIEGSEGNETLDKDKEKWWENERRVFRGRADSFIARMHLVQGDRRFSRWKGSVVDSVIGVFLTQNVSDHLSSSAFMSLASRFPLKSTATNETCCDRACEQPIAVAEPNEVIKHHEQITSLESSEGMTHQISSSEGAPKKHSRVSEEEVLVSQDSFDSSTVQTVEEFRSSSGSNSETEDVTTGYETSKQSGPPIDLAEKKLPTMLKDYSGHELLEEHAMHHLPKEPECNMQTPTTNRINLTSSPSQFQMGMAPGLQKAGLLNSEVLGGESRPSLPSSISGMTDAYHTSTVTHPQDEMPTFQAPSLVQYNLQSSVPGQFLNTNHQMTEVFKETTEHGETTAEGKIGSPKQDSCIFGRIHINVEDSISAVNKQNCFENTVTEANSKEQKAFHEPSGPGPNISKAKKGTAEDERSKTVDWDSLRKEALANGGKKERSKDASDSLDYEALRRAHVNEISDAIKERGMNNLLADRMKDFLNRLVRDHGAIDLEWLRDAPPDKAKDYLLSFRGLGLKSVECVRLLTLHHLAFPVDTNVGRIAVRLGWVPLQPLPESLQLHLLEMYPVLESIQKYLWPRLCKLDQLTLYELHYQMITFGKVFCTKSRPNCNACPMRAECRHFASAYASARLSLPGPEEKRIVPSDAPVATDPIPPMVNRSIVLPLPPAENDLNKSGRNCEPIIEEPTTPEPEAAELSISDIEDQYYEDFDEIPSIKLNMEEFTTNLQNIMQDGKELQDNMSKALVALNPTAASIPTPKLKDVSRLRTEHLVYELPDSHQLLKGLDRREPDDPSHYLLAIWTPGETANSVQPPEIECPLQQSGQLCDRATCFSCNNVKEANSQVVRGTILIPCRTAMRGSFPLNGTYFQVNEMFADHASSLNPIDVPRAWIWNLPRRTVYFGTSVSTIFKGLSTEGIQYCFWKGFVCVRGFDRVNRSPRPLMARLHFPASKLITQRTKANK